MSSFIRQRGNTRTAYWHTIDPATGNRVQHSKGGFKTKGAAQAHLNGIMSRVQEGSWQPDKPITVKELLNDHWFPAQKTRDLRPSTLWQYRNVIDAWIVPNIGGIKVAALTPAVVNEMVDTLRTAKSSRGLEGLSTRSAQLTVQVLKSACAWALVNGLLTRDPVGGIKRPRSKARVMQVWDTEQAKTFLDHTKNDRLAFAWSLALTRGLRRGEICGLRWSNVDLDKGVIRINETRLVVGSKVVESTPKTEEGRRSIPLDPSLVAILRRHKTRQASEKLAAGKAYQDDGYLLTDELGRPYRPDRLSCWFADKLATAKLPRIRLHDTRHTAGTLMLASGVSTKVVTEMLGHSSPTITLAIYAHVLPGMAEEAGAALSASLLG
jgi:integrase